MPNGVKNGNGNGLSAGRITFSVSIGALLALLATAYINLSNQTNTALDVARQHGEEFNSIRREVSNLQGELRGAMDEIHNDLVQGTHDRFKGTDWDREDRRISERLAEIERRLERLENYHP